MSTGITEGPRWRILEVRSASGKSLSYGRGKDDDWGFRGLGISARSDMLSVKDSRLCDSGEFRIDASSAIGTSFWACVGRRCCTYILQVSLNSSGVRMARVISSEKGSRVLTDEGEFLIRRTASDSITSASVGSGGSAGEEGREESDEARPANGDGDAGRGDPGRGDCTLCMCGGRPVG
jgi:hypothetical protein